ncbi:response regulator transcription factor [Tessaracoccus sp. HF-7]|nr:response regulator transcription factor [Tessaracoccus caeni]MDF1487770.1 response regulator transcription factor [Tessaracoccus caeni]
MSQLLYLSSSSEPPAELALLSHKITRAESASQALAEHPGVDIIVIDARSDLSGAHRACQLLHNSGTGIPRLLLVEVNALAVISRDWGFTDFIVAGAQPSEFDARLKMMLATEEDSEQLVAGPIRVDGAAYSATLDGTPLDLTYTEFELLRYLMQHPGRVLSRETLVSQVWGYDYYGGTRTVDVHVRRLRAKLGQYDHYIGTVRNVGYRFASSREVHLGGDG